MINLSISKKSMDQLFGEFKKKSGAISSINTEYNREQIAKAAFTVLGKEFVRQVNRYSAANKDSMHHVYEWGKVGQNSARLFVLNRKGVRGGKLVISTKFITSKTPVPVSPVLRRPGRTGKSVKGGHVFKNKAEIMERGRAVHISAKRAKALAFPGRDGKVVFVPRGWYVTVRNPGGKAVKGSFDSYTKAWFRNPSNTIGILETCGYFLKLEKEIAKTLNKNGSGSTNVATTIKKVSDQYSKGVTVI